VLYNLALSDNITLLPAHRICD